MISADLLNQAVVEFPQVGGKKGHKKGTKRKGKGKGKGKGRKGKGTKKRSRKH